MNTVRSVGYGWGVLVAAGGGAYFFAKRSINSDRAERAEAEERRRQALRRLEYTNPPPQKKDGHANPSKEAQEDMSPATGHAEESDGKAQPLYETAQPFRSKKGDRFS